MKKNDNQTRIMIHIPVEDTEIRDKLSELAKKNYQSFSRTIYIILKEYFDAQKDSS